MVPTEDMGGKSVANKEKKKIGMYAFLENLVFVHL